MRIPPGLSPAARRFVEVLAGRPDLPERLARMALVFRKLHQFQDARLLARRALDLAPGDARVRLLAEWVDRREVPLWHFQIAQDAERNGVYAAALERCVRPGMTVFEIGTGTGLLAMLAVRAGARHVYTCERHAEVAATAREVVARNGMAERITVLAVPAEEVELPERLDLFVAEIVDNSLLGEGVVPLTRLARRRFLKPGATLLPGVVSTWGSLATLGDNPSCRLSGSMGFDLGPFNRFAPPVVCLGAGGDGAELLSEPQELLSFDLSSDLSPEPRRLELVATSPGVAEGLLRWIRLDFGGGLALENRPPARSASWFPCMHLFPEPRLLAVGDVVTVEVSHDEERVFVVADRLGGEPGGDAERRPTAGR